VKVPETPFAPLSAGTASLLAARFPVSKARLPLVLFQFLLRIRLLISDPRLFIVLPWL